MSTYEKKIGFLKILDREGPLSTFRVIRLESYNTHTVESLKSENIKGVTNRSYLY